MSRRFFANSLISSEQCLLDGPEAHHLINVMRAKVGDQVILFDGTGHEFQAIVEEINRKQVTMHILEKRSVSRELPMPLIMGVSLPKGERQRILIEKLVEIGATNLVPLITDRGVARPEKKVISRLERTVVESCKQCGRNVLMAIEEPQECSDFFANIASQTIKLLALPGAVQGINHEQPATTDPSDVRSASNLGVKKTTLSDRMSYACAIGPEGGFTEREIATATGHGWRAVNLGPRILRAETAAIVMAAYLSLANS